MHKFFRGSKKTIAAMMAVLMFTSSTGGYAQARYDPRCLPGNTGNCAGCAGEYRYTSN